MKMTEMRVNHNAVKWHIKHLEKQGWRVDDITVNESTGEVKSGVLFKDDTRLTVRAKGRTKHIPNTMLSHPPTTEKADKKLAEIKRRERNQREKKRREKIAGKKINGPTNILQKGEFDHCMGAQVYLEKIQMNEEVMALSAIEINDVDQVRARITEYFAICKKYKSPPTLGGLGLALKITRQKIHAIMANANGKYNPEVAELLNVTYQMYESLWEGYMLDGTIVPNSGMFIGKNQFGYKDVVEHNVVTEVKPVFDEEKIKAKYLSGLKEVADESALPENTAPGSEQAENEDGKNED